MPSGVGNTISNLYEAPIGKRDKLSPPQVNSYYKMQKVGFQIIQESAMKPRVRFDSNRREDPYVSSAAGLEKEMGCLMILSAGKTLERGKTLSSSVR